MIVFSARINPASTDCQGAVRVDSATELPGIGPLQLMHKIYPPGTQLRFSTRTLWEITPHDRRQL